MAERVVVAVAFAIARRVDKVGPGQAILKVTWVFHAHAVHVRVGGIETGLSRTVTQDTET